MIERAQKYLDESQIYTNLDNNFNIIALLTSQTDHPNNNEIYYNIINFQNEKKIIINLLLM